MNRVPRPRGPRVHRSLSARLDARRTHSADFWHGCYQVRRRLALALKVHLKKLQKLIPIRSNRTVPADVFEIADGVEYSGSS
jgi:hypothetical protein